MKIVKLLPRKQDCKFTIEDITYQELQEVMIAFNHMLYISNFYTNLQRERVSQMQEKVREAMN